MLPTPRALHSAPPLPQRPAFLSGRGGLVLIRCLRTAGRKAGPRPRLRLLDAALWPAGFGYAAAARKAIFVPKLRLTTAPCGRVH